MDLSELLFAHGGSLLFEHVAIPGARQMLKLMKAPSLVKLQSRLSLTLLKDGIDLAQGTADRNIRFRFLIPNPTPWKISITSIDCSIGYENVVYARNCRCVEPFPIEIPQETIPGKLFTVIYEPFLTTLGIPPKKEGWFIEGNIYISSDFGPFAFPMPVSQHLRVEITDDLWNKSRDYVHKTILGEQ